MMRKIGFIKMFNSVNTQKREEGVTEIINIVESLFNKKLNITAVDLVNELSSIDSNVKFFKMAYEKIRSEL